MKKSFLALAFMSLICGFCFANPKLQFDVGADFAFDYKNLTPGFKYDLQLVVPVYKNLDFFVGVGQSIHTLMIKESTTNHTVFFTKLMAGVDYRFDITQKDSICPSLGLGCTIISSQNVDNYYYFTANANVFYIRKLTELLDLNFGLGFYYNEFYTDLDAKLGLSIKF